MPQFQCDCHPLGEELGLISFPIPPTLSPVKSFKCAVILFFSLFVFTSLSLAAGNPVTAPLSAQERREQAQEARAEKKRLNDLARAERMAEREQRRQARIEAIAEKRRLNGLTKTGAGTLTLSGSSTYPEGTVVTGGTLTLGEGLEGGAAMTNEDIGAGTLTLPEGGNGFAFGDLGEGFELAPGLQMGGDSLIMGPGSFDGGVIGVVPEPGTVVLSLTALALLGVVRRRTRSVQ